MHPNPRNVFIGGGGEGGTLREILAHRSVERAVMVDLDEQVVELCREHLPQHHQGAFDDPRTELIFGDARKYLETSNQQFDVMIMDLVDPLEGGPAYLLYTEEYYEIARARLKPGGILVTQSGPAGYLSLRECFTTIFKTLDQIFAHAAPYHTHVPSFITLWGLHRGVRCTIAEHVAGRSGQTYRGADYETATPLRWGNPRCHVHAATSHTRWHRGRNADQPGRCPVFMV